MLKLAFTMTRLMEILKIHLEEQLPDKAFNIGKNSKCDGYQRGLASMVYKFFEYKKLQMVLLKMNSCKIEN